MNNTQIKKLIERLRYIHPNEDRHGNLRIYVRRNGRLIRIKENPKDWVVFQRAYTEAIEALGAPPEHARPNGRTLLPGSLAALATKYFGGREFKQLDATSQTNRRQIVEDCLREKIIDNKELGDMPAKLFNASHMKWLMEQKEEKNLYGAANNRRKYFSVMLAWAVQQSTPLISRNAARDVKMSLPKTDGFYTWTDDDVLKFEAHFSVGTKARLALGLMLYTGLRRSDAVRVGPQNVRNGMIEITPQKTKALAPEITYKPVLPDLAEIIAGTPTIGLKTFLVTEHGKPFTSNGFGNWFRDRCNEAGLPDCTAHGLRKAAACRCADAGASIHDLMKLFDWRSPAVATRYIQKADKKLATERTIKLLSRKGIGE